MKSLALRPRFSKQINLKPEELIKQIIAFSKKPNKQIETTIVDNHIYFRFTTVYQHYWSPQLSLEIKEEDQKTLVKGLFGPNPKVWSMFLFLYSGIGFIGSVGLLFGLVQLNLNIVPSGMWIVLGAIIFELIFYLLAGYGKKIAANQMMILQKELEYILDTGN